MQTNNANIEEFYKFIFEELISIVSIDEKGNVVNFDKKIEKTDDKVLRIYSTEVEDIKNTEIINPLAESIGKVMPKGNRYFYTALAIGLKMKIMQIIASMSEALESEVSDEDKKSTAIINFVSKFKDFDAKIVEEVKLIIQDLSMPLEFVNVYYNSNKREAVFRSVVFEEDFVDKYRKEYKVRKKTLTFLINFMKTVLGIKSSKELDKFRTKATSLKCPMFQSILTVYYLVYEAANQILEIFDLNIDITKLKNFIDNIDTYSDKARWLTPQISTSKSTIQSQPTRKQSKLEKILSQSMSVSTPKFSSQPTSKIGKIPIVTDSPSIFSQPIPQPVNSYPSYNQPIYNYQQTPQISWYNPQHTQTIHPIDLNRPEPIKIKIT